VFLIAASIALSCDQGIGPDGLGPQQSMSTIIFSLAAGSIPTDVRSVLVRLERQGFATFSDSATVQTGLDSVTITFHNIPPGTWMATIEARDVQGVTRYTGSSSVVVTAGQVAQVYVQMTLVTGGDVRITLVWGTPAIRWKMGASNPVLKQTSGYWDQDHYYLVDPVILHINGIYQMWYQSGLNRTNNPSGNDAFWIAYATSPDGITWTKQGPVIGPGPQGTWMDMGPYSPCVIYEDGTYKMWFVGGKTPLAYRNGVGYATSTDGKNWTVDLQPVIDVSVVGQTCSPSVVKVGNVYNLFIGTTTSTTAYPLVITLMTSVDGRNWSSKGVVLSARQDLAWQRSGVLPGEVIYDRGRFKMFYTAFNVQEFCLGYAESADGIVWDNSSILPILSPSDTGPWLTKEVGFPAVMRDNGVLRMWISGISTQTSRYQIGYAEQVQ
jgi:hypothetical protein